MPHGLRPAAGGSVIVVANTMDGALDLINPTTDTYEGCPRRHQSRASRGQRRR